MKDNTVLSEFWSNTSSATVNNITMNKGMQAAFFLVVAVSLTSAQYGYQGYPYNAAPHGAPQPVGDTPEVAAAKAAHFAAYNAHAAAAAASPEYNHGGPAYSGQYAGAPNYGAPGYGAPGYSAPGYSAPYGGPAYAGAPNIVNGVPADTPEVAAAKAAHLAAHARAG